MKINKTDNLWQSLQQGIKNYIQNNSYGNVITVNTPVTWRPKYDEIKDVLIKNKPLSTLECN
jgi:Skp family chaperone for outer membrane proteins